MIFTKGFIFLRIPYEEGGGRSVKFDLDAFVTFKLHSATSMPSDTLSRPVTGRFRRVEIASRVRLTFRDELYKVQLSSKEMDTFVKVLLRMYTVFRLCHH